MKFIKGVVVGLAVVWLAGCATNDQMGTSGESVIVDVTESEMVETLPLLDPAVQAVLDTGMVEASAEQIAELLEKDSIHFPYDSDRLDDEDIAVLDVQAAYLTSPAGINEKLVIEGHTDERGTRTYNLALGERRAMAVKNYLVLKGVVSSRIEVVSYGFETPINTMHNETAWSENRRAVVVKEG